MKKSKMLSFDVMLGGKFIKTYEIMQGPFILDEKEVRKFVEERLPTLRGKNFKVEFN